MMMFFVLCVAGLWGFHKLPIARFPDISLPDGDGHHPAAGRARPASWKPRSRARSRTRSRPSPASSASMSDGQRGRQHHHHRVRARDRPGHRARRRPRRGHPHPRRPAAGHPGTDRRQGQHRRLADDLRGVGRPACAPTSCQLVRRPRRRPRRCSACPAWRRSAAPAASTGRCASTCDPDALQAFGVTAGAGVAAAGAHPGRAARRQDRGRRRAAGHPHRRHGRTTCAALRDYPISLPDGRAVRLSALAAGHRRRRRPEPGRAARRQAGGRRSRCRARAAPARSRWPRRVRAALGGSCRRRAPGRALPAWSPPRSRRPSAPTIRR